MNIIEFLSVTDPIFKVGLFLFATTVFLVFYLINKVQVIAILKKNITHLNNTLQELDQQAKLIIKTDMELKLHQEDMEDKLNKLTLIKNLVLDSINILDQEKLFLQINEKTINDLGFQKGIILNFDDLEIKANVGFASKEIERIKDFLTTNKSVLNTEPLLSGDSTICKTLLVYLGCKDILITPIKARKDIHAIFILSHPLILGQTGRAEKEMLFIIATYMGQCLENIKLFEELYHIKEALENKVKERTHDLVKSLRKIENISKMKSDFISSVSHELRTPLTSVKGFSSLLVEEKLGKLPPQAKKRLERIDENVDKLVGMVNTLLDISRIESGKTEVKIAPADIVKLIKNVGDFLSPQIQNKQIQFTTDTPGTLNVYMDTNLIERVLINLINNAIKFSPQEGKITLGCSEKENHAVISVSDTGCGIPKDDLEKIFREFYRTQLTQGIQGSGLGLSLVKRIIDTHKEKLWVESEVGKGTTFYFTLKLERTRKDTDRDTGEN